MCERNQVMMIMATSIGTPGRPVPGPEPGKKGPPGRRWPWWLLRSFLTIQAADVVFQPVFAGRFLSGDFAMLTAHRTNATYVGILSISQIFVAILAWRTAQAPSSLVGATVALAAAVALQIFLGFARILGIHVPLGVAVVAFSSWLAIWTWTHGPGDRLTVLRREQA
jgi:heme A synthase